MDIPGELREFVQRPDPAMRWKVQESRQEGGVTLTALQLVSQVWQGEEWTHRLQLFLPDTISCPQTALLYVTGLDLTQSEKEMGILLALETGMPCAFLFHLPNQPLFNGRYEDGIIAYTFQQYIDTGEIEWPLLLPMVKSVTSAMDAVQAYSREHLHVPVERFIVSGASKRGWTSWLSAVADARVVGIIPMVFDNLNFFAQMPHQVEMWGGYSESIADYTEYDLQAQMATERGQYLVRLVDPYTYRDTLTLPKLLINGANDPYWATDAVNIYWNDLIGPKSLLNIPNAGHGLPDIARLYTAVIAFMQAMAGNRTLPEVEALYREQDGKIVLTISTEETATSASLWVAHAPTKDFRPAEWNRVSMRSSEPGGFVGEFAIPETGHMALYGEVVFTIEGHTFPLSTVPYIV